jgi:hypothetical protein
VAREDAEILVAGLQEPSTASTVLETRKCPAVEGKVRRAGSEARVRSAAGGPTFPRLTRVIQESLDA